jgi:hypothetical protein
MATLRKSVLGFTTLPESGVFPDTIANQITEATAPSIGSQLCYVMADGGADEGLYFSFQVPKNYVGTPKLVVKGVLDGAPGASDTLGFGFRKRAVANNEAADGTYDAEQTVSATIGSGGSAHSDEDQFELVIDLTAGDYAVDDQVYGYVYVDASGTSYAGNVLLTSVEFQYADA